MLKTDKIALYAAVIILSLPAHIFLLVLIMNVPLQIALPGWLTMIAGTALVYAYIYVAFTINHRIYRYLNLRIVRYSLLGKKKKRSEHAQDG